MPSPVADRLMDGWTAGCMNVDEATAWRGLMTPPGEEVDSVYVPYLWLKINYGLIMLRFTFTKFHFI